jgi:hypothetical protein
MALVDRRLLRAAGGASVTLTIDLPSTSRTSPDRTREIGATKLHQLGFGMRGDGCGDHVFRSSLQRSVRPCFLVDHLSNVDATAASVLVAVVLGVVTFVQQRRQHTVDLITTMLSAERDCGG